nr:translation initiation factor Sui1 [Desulfobulbaceae bacterium]
MSKHKSDSGLIYSTEHGRMCPACKRSTNACSCSTKTTTVKGDGVVRVSRETKGRKGKGVTLISGLELDADSLKKLAKELKQKCGGGGTLKLGIIEIQGDHCEVVTAELKSRGFLVKRVGG